eukprot:m.1376903 g.1376903  ORF g.1376903 m.1376903 type:complete len:867 (-) comp24964_c1_seq5:1162-3762(-)
MLVLVLVPHTHLGRSSVPVCKLSIQSFPRTTMPGLCHSLALTMLVTVMPALVCAQEAPQIIAVGSNLNITAADVQFLLGGSAAVSLSATFAQTNQSTASISQLQQSSQGTAAILNALASPFHVVACGQSSSIAACGGVSTTALNSEAHEVACCSDTALGDFVRRSPNCPFAGRFQAPLTCDDTPGSPTQNSFQCGSGSGGDYQSCNHNASFLQAWQYCTGIGARLCTLDEVSSDCTATLGCAHNTDMLWTSTPAPYVVPPAPIASARQISGLIAQITTTATDTHFTACGSGRIGQRGSNCPGNMQFASADNTEMHEVACCSDTPIDSFIQRPASATFGYSCPYVSRDGSALQCATSGQWVNSMACSDNCNDNATYMQAVMFCTAAGARLCTKDEVVNGCIAGIGCGHNDDMVWTSTPTAAAEEQAQADGLLAQMVTTSGLYHMVACGGSATAHTLTCGTSSAAADNNELHATACCSDEPLGGFTQRSTTDTGGYNCPFTSRLDNPLKCFDSGLQQNSQNCADGNCNLNATYAQAVAFCTAAGARLCTVEEIANGCSASLGCGTDRDLIWTSTAVPNPTTVAQTAGLINQATATSSSHYVACGGDDFGACGAQQLAANNQEMHEVSCCSDVPLGGFVQRLTGCPYVARKQSPLLCFEDGPLKNSNDCGSGADFRCNHNATYGQAVSYCTSVGARLCTREEVLDQCTAGSGCLHDGDLLWTATPSPPVPPFSQYMIACGNSIQITGGCGVNTTAADITEVHEVACCSDVRPNPQWRQRYLTSCPFAARSQPPLQCNEIGPFANSMHCGATSSDQCNNAATFVQAKTFCESVGTRLCTLNELLNDCTAGTGCGHDGDLIWSSTPAAAMS